MDKKGVFDVVTHMEDQMGSLYEELGHLKQMLSEMLKENHRLIVENENLRRHFDLTKKEGKADRPATDSGTIAEEKSFLAAGKNAGYDNLSKLYQEGFHVCHIHFGRPRGQDEDCLFCLSLLNKK